MIPNNLSMISMYVLNDYSNKLQEIDIFLFREILFEEKEIKK